MDLAQDTSLALTLATTDLAQNTSMALAQMMTTSMALDLAPATTLVLDTKYHWLVLLFY